MLFIGNSFTMGASGSSSVGTIFDHIANAKGEIDPYVFVRATGGVTFRTHYFTDATQEAIRAEQWTHVILQNYSTDPTHLGDGSGLSNHYEYGELLYDAIIANNPGTQVILYETWSRAADHSLISGQSTSSSFASTAEMQSELRFHYRALAERLNNKHPENKPVIVAPVGDSWENIGGLLDLDDPDYVNVHGSDRYHGNDNGYYLAGAIFYGVIYGQSAEGAYAVDPVVTLTQDGVLLEQTAWKTLLSAGIGNLVVQLDFGAEETALEGWNVIAPTTLSTTGLVDAGGQTTSIDLTVEFPFSPDALTGGTEDSSIFPPTVTIDSLAATEGPSPQFRLSGLSSESRYRFTFYASLPEGTENHETLFAVEGSHEVTGTLDPVGNIDRTIEIGPVLPTPSGEISVTLSAGANNDAPPPAVHLGAVRVAQYPYTPLEITGDPTNVQIVEGESAEFTVEVHGTPPLTFRWFLNDEFIPSATEPTLTLENTRRNLDGGRIHAVVSDGSVEVPSTEAILTVTHDITPPEVISISSDNDGSTLIINFSEPLAATATGHTEGFRILCGDTLLPVVSVEFGDDQASLVLSLAAPPFDELTIDLPMDIHDVAENALSGGNGLSLPFSPVRETQILLDFGSDASLTGTENGTHWNNISETIGLSDSGSLSDLVDSDGDHTAITLQMLARFGGGNRNGTTASSWLPTTATNDSLYGNTASFGGLSNVFPSFKLTNLDSEATYGLTFYASRTGVSDNRETTYTITADSVVELKLDPANNLDTSVGAEGIAPDANGEIRIAITPGSNNTNSNRFTYLGTLILHISRPLEPLTPPVLRISTTQGHMQLEWEGEAYLHTAETLEGPWKVVFPTPAPPYGPSIPEVPRFYRLRR